MQRILLKNKKGAEEGLSGYKPGWGKALGNSPERARGDIKNWELQAM